MTDVIGMNGVAIPARQHDGAAFRTYEVYQRERVGQSTEKISPMQLVSDEYTHDPFVLSAILREHYPCYRDWLNNSYWISRYDDVTSIFADTANFEKRSKLWRYGLPDFGRDMGQELPVQTAWATGMDRHAERVAEVLLSSCKGGEADLASGFAARYPIWLLAKTLGIADADIEQFALLYWQAQRGANWQPKLMATGQQALHALVEYFSPAMQTRRLGDADDLISAVAGAGGSAQDLVTTLLEADHETLHGALANLWCLLLQHPQALDNAKKDPRLLKIAYLETLRHSPGVVSTSRYARHEVERFGRLIPQGALMTLSAAGANRDPRIFADPDTFLATRNDICHREARGQFRADGLASGIAFGLGTPSIYPAIPEDRPRSLYALTRDTALTASQVLIEACPNLRLQQGAEPVMRCLGVGEIYACWSLPVTFDI